MFLFVSFHVTLYFTHSRLAMLAIAGFVAQELVNAKEIFVTLGVAPDDFDPSSLPVPDPTPFLN